jgi:catechol 2,3-dioxygenase-like lactoylglutathione lyase family enzyme
VSQLRHFRGELETTADPAQNIPMAFLNIDHIDHVVMTVEDADITINWYLRVLQIKSAVFGEGRKALLLNKQKINLHPMGSQIEPKAHAPTPGSLDICLMTTTPLAQVIEHLKVQRVTVEKGPIKRNGATGLITSIYIRDPDRNLIEISNLG